MENVLAVLPLKKSLRAVSIQLIVHCLQADAEQFRRARLVVASLVERSQDHLSLDLFERRAHRKANRVFRAHALSLVEWIRREVMTLNLFA